MAAAAEGVEEVEGADREAVAEEADTVVEGVEEGSAAQRLAAEVDTAAEEADTAAEGADAGAAEVADAAEVVDAAGACG